MTDALIISPLAENQYQLTTLNLNKLKKAQAIHELHQFYYVPNVILNELDLLQRTIRNSHKRLDQLAQLFDQQLIIGLSALCEVSGQTHHPFITCFNEVKFRDRSKHVFIRGIDQVIAHKENITHLNIVTGPCLFSNQAVRLFYADGKATPGIINAQKFQLEKRIKEILVENELSLYEYESATRLALTITDLLEIASIHLQITVTLDIPQVQYYFYLMQAFEQGLIDKELLLDWFKKVNLRRLQVLNLLRITLNLSVSLPIETKEAAALNFLSEYLWKTIQANKKPKLTELLNLISGSADHMWQLVLEVETPATFQELGILSYAVEELRTSISWDGKLNAVGLAVENHPERKILEKALPIAKKIMIRHPEINFLLFGIYPLEKIFTGKQMGRSNLYYNDPGRYVIDSHGQEHDLFAIVDALYSKREPASVPILLAEDI